MVIPSVELACFLSVAACVLACSSSADSSTAASCVAPADLCARITIKDINDACPSSTSEALVTAQAEGDDPAAYRASNRACKYRGSSGGGTVVSITLTCFHDSDGASNAQSSYAQIIAASGPQTEEAVGISDQAQYRYTASPHFDELVSRQGAVVVSATLLVAAGTRDTTKTCLAAMVKKTLATTK